MYISLEWLKDYVTIPSDISPKKLGDDITVHIAEVEEVVDQAAAYEHMVIGEIKEIKDHPNADKLKICLTDVGEKDLSQIICGGENIYEGMKVAVAQISAKVRWHGEGDLVEMKKAKIRGEESNGMICASAEINLAESTEKQPEGPTGVMDLKDNEATPGTPLAQALGLTDVIIEVDNKSITNRPDLWGHRGIAREIAAMYEVQYTDQEIKENPIASDTAPVSITIESELCSRYIGIKMDGVKVAESPDWLKQRLLAVGQRPINNLVDISNYVMFEVGQPVHIFDATKITDETVIVRTAMSGEKMTTLDGVERELDESTLMIADPEKLIAIAGVMGGGNSEVEDDTSTIIIEAAHFDAKSVRKTSQKLGLRTEASARFEKGLDPHLAQRAALRVAELVSRVIPDAKIVSPVSDVGNWQYTPHSITVDVDFMDQRVGASVGKKSAIAILERLGCQVTDNNNHLDIMVPSWRQDLVIPEDIVEEISRLYGYDNIPSIIPLVDTKSKQQTNFDLPFRREVKQYLSLSAGLQEVENSVFAFESAAKKIDPQYEDRVVVTNPLAEGQEYLRKFLLPGLLKNTKENLRYYDAFGLYEMGRIFKTQPSQQFTKSLTTHTALPDQPKRLGMVLANKHASKEELFYDMKGIVIGLLDHMRIEYEIYPQDAHSWMQSGYELGLSVDGTILGELGLFDSGILISQKIEYPVAVAYINYEYLETLGKREARFVPLPEFPALTRDIAVVVDTTALYQDLEKTIVEQSPLLEKVSLFDVYEGKQIGEGKRSYAWHLVLRDREKTLTSDEADTVLQNIITALEKKHNAVLRS